MIDYDKYKRELMKLHDLANVEHAHWINSKNRTNSAVILSFQCDMPSHGYLEELDLNQDFVGVQDRGYCRNL